MIQRSPAPQDLSHTTVDEWELPKEEFTIQEKLGSGYFADVHRGMWKGCVSVAIKILKSDGKYRQYLHSRHTEPSWIRD